MIFWRWRELRRNQRRIEAEWEPVRPREVATTTPPATAEDRGRRGRPIKMVRYADNSKHNNTAKY